MKIAAFIDGPNLYASAKALSIDLDYAKILTYLRSRGHVVRAFYYTSILDEQEFTPLRPLVDWLDYNGFTMVTKAAKKFTDYAGREKVKGNMDIELAVDMLEIAPHVDEIYLFSGDGDFRKLVEAVQRRGCRVNVVSTLQSSPPMVADELRRQADEYTDLAAIESMIRKTQKPTKETTDNEKFTPEETATLAARNPARLSLRSDVNSVGAGTEPFNAPRISTSRRRAG